MRYGSFRVATSKRPRPGASSAIIRPASEIRPSIEWTSAPYTDASIRFTSGQSRGTATTHSIPARAA